MGQANNIKRTIIITLILMAAVVGLVWLNITHGNTAASSDVSADERPEVRASAPLYAHPLGSAN